VPFPPSTNSVRGRVVLDQRYVAWQPEDDALVMAQRVRPYCTVVFPVL